MASAPQEATRTVPRHCAAPPIRAANAPRAASSTSVLSVTVANASRVRGGGRTARLRDVLAGYRGYAEAEVIGEVRRGSLPCIIHALS